MCQPPAPHHFLDDGDAIASSPRQIHDQFDILTPPHYSHALTNGSVKSPASPADDDTADEAAPSPPLSSSSSVSSVAPDVLGDEIVVGTTGPHAAPVSNGEKSLPGQAASEREDEQMADQPDSEPIAHYPKRKRTSFYNDLGEDKLEGSNLSFADEVETPTAKVGVSKRHGAGHAKDVVLGYWRDSTFPKPEGKHSVVGFMDIRDRLRTRIQNTTIGGEPINLRLWGIPAGPGGSWVTFERIVFHDHLVGLDHNEIKEYVKIRTDAADEDEAAKKENELAAVVEAKRRVQMNPPPEQAQPPPVAYGADIPENANIIQRPDAKRRRTGSAMGTISTDAPVMPMQFDAQQHSQQMLMNENLDELRGTRPTRVLVGVWSKSSGETEDDKHAVYGILGANDMFRVKLVRETKNGQFVNGNFPTGAGALWIAYEEVTFLNHIRGLTRPEMKEYVRVRQWQLDHGEDAHNKVANETHAVYLAQSRAAIQAAKGNNPTPPATGRPYNMNGYDEMQGSPVPEPTHELRHSRRDLVRPVITEVDPRQGSRHQSLGPLERTNELARREVHRLEARNNVAANHQMQQNQAIFQDNMGRLDKVWRHQEVQRNGPMPAHMTGLPMVNSDDFKTHNNVRYERKQTGPFAGKLVSPGAIINIDGEDYVEYRVLTKPSFF